MKIIDNSGGFWTDLIIRRKNPSLTVQSKIYPDEAFRQAMAREAISSIRGSVRHKFVPEMKDGKLIFHAFKNGTYENGILKRRSPDGIPWPELKDSTLRNREYMGNPRGPTFILRATSKHIYNGLKIVRTAKGPRANSIDIGWMGEDAEIAELQDAGFETYGPIFGKETIKAMTVPARRFRGFQQQFIDTFFETLRAVVERFR